MSPAGTMTTRCARVRLAVGFIVKGSLGGTRNNRSHYYKPWFSLAMYILTVEMFTCRAEQD